MDEYGIGARVKYLREARGRSQQQVADAVGRSRSGIATVETRGSDSLALAVDFCHAFGLTLQQFFNAPIPGARLSPERLATLDAALGIDAANTPSVTIRRTLGQKAYEDPVLVLEPEGSWKMLERRDAIKLAGTAMLLSMGGAMPVVLNPDQAGAVTNALRTQAVNHDAIDSYRAILAALRQAEDRLGSHPSLLRATEVHLATLEGWLRSQQAAAVVTPLTRLAAEYGQFGGWLAFDGGNATKAIEFYGGALERAQMLSDRPLTAYILGLMARVGEGTGQAVRHARQATSVVEATRAWRVHSAVGAYNAECLARSGAREEGIPTIGRATDALERAQAVEPEPYLYFYDHSTLTRLRGHTMVYAGRHAEGRAALHDAAKAMGPEYVRDRAYVLTAVADSHAAAGEVSEACQTASRAVELLRSTSSIRMVRQLRGIHRRLAMRGASAPVRELGELLKAV